MKYITFHIKKNRFSTVILVILLIQSCTKESEKDKIVTLNDKYITEMNTGYRFSRVTYLGTYPGSGYDKLFTYSEKEVKVTYFNSGNLISTYFLNNNGLADSCIEGSKLIKYQYDNDNYLISFSSFPTIWTFPQNIFGYKDGNRIFASDEINSVPSYYEFNSLLNFIDIESFHGSFLGRLNKNLISKKNVRLGAHGNEQASTDYEYILNAKGLVVQRTGITTDFRNKINPTTTKIITYFEYIIKK